MRAWTSPGCTDRSTPRRISGRPSARPSPVDSAGRACRSSMRKSSAHLLQSITTTRIVVMAQATNLPPGRVATRAGGQTVRHARRRIQPRPAPRQPQGLGAEHIGRYVATGGTDGHEWNGTSACCSPTRARESGLWRRTALIYGRVPGPSRATPWPSSHPRVAPRATQPGTRALVAHPDCRVQVMGDVYDVRAAHRDAGRAGRHLAGHDCAVAGLRRVRREGQGVRPLRDPRGRAGARLSEAHPVVVARSGRIARIRTSPHRGRPDGPSRWRWIGPWRAPW